MNQIAGPHNSLSPASLTMPVDGSQEATANSNHSGQYAQSPAEQSRTRSKRKYDSTFQRLAVTAAKMPNSSINSFCGAMAGVASGVVTCPLDVIKTRLQGQGSFRRHRNPRTAALYNGLWGTAKTIWREDGVRGMYRGLGPMLLGYLPTWAVYMSVYDSSKDYYYAHIGECHFSRALLRLLRRG